MKCHYQADLTSSKGMKFATFDTGIKHTAAEVVAQTAAQPGGET